jgi:acyl carrier protein
MNTFDEVKSVLIHALQLGDRGTGLHTSSPLLGAMPELDSLAVVSVITSLEERFGFFVDDDEISAETFETLGSLVEFVETKLSS